jgi:hypothetical protein
VPDPKLDDRAFLDSTMRLRAAGVIESVAHDVRSGNGAVRFTAAYHRLLMAGRRPLEEEEFRDAWLSGDPARVRSWIGRESAMLEASNPESRTKRAL